VKAAGVLRLDDGVFVATEFSAKGGVEYRRSATRVQETARGQRAEWDTTRHIPNAELHFASKQIVGRAQYLVGRWCATTPLGYYLPDRNRRSFEEAMLPVAEAADVFNAEAERAGYDRRVRVAYYTFTVATDDTKIAARLAETVLERLRALSTALHARDRDAYDRARDVARNLEALAVGIQREAIEAALECATLARKKLVEDPGALLDLEPLDAAERLFY
jgi:hypothetical protein